jgi:putative transposase
MPYPQSFQDVLPSNSHCTSPSARLVRDGDIPANAHDVTAIMNLLNQPIIPRPKTRYRVHHLCADKAYDSELLRNKLHKRKFKPHIRKRDYASDPPPPPLESDKHPARRWVVERTLSWQNDFRSLLVRWAKKSSNWLALIFLLAHLSYGECALMPNLRIGSR